METVFRNIPENICKYDPQHAVNLSKSGAEVKGIYKQLSLFHEEYKDSQVKRLLYMLVQTIYPGITPKTQLKRYVGYWCVYNISFPTQLFSIPKYYQNLEKNLSATSVISMNQSLFNLCARSQRIHSVSHKFFAVNGSLNESLFWKDRIHTNKRGLPKLAFHLIKGVSYCRFLSQ